MRLYDRQLPFAPNSCMITDGPTRVSTSTSTKVTMTGAKWYEYRGGAELVSSTRAEARSQVRYRPSRSRRLLR